MGIILSRFRKKKTTIEILEDLDSKIKAIEQYGQNTEQRHKKIVGMLVIYSVVLYIMTAFIFYIYFFPASLYDQMFYITPLLIFPILILFTKKMVTWYYKRKLSRNQEKLSSMQDEKKKILEEVTETETYKKAKEILLKFAPDQLKITSLSAQPIIKITSDTPRQTSTPQAIVSPLPGAGELRRRVLTGANLSNMPSGTPTNVGKEFSNAPVPVGSAPTQSPQPSSPYTGVRTINAATPIGSRSPLPRPILPSHRSYLDRLVDYLVGDGPSNRYALICRECGSHNGMALKEEFEYFAFRCCFCNSWNPARKQKPSAPKLEQCENINPSTPVVQAETEHAIKSIAPVKFGDLETSSPSDTDSDIEVVEKPLENSDVPDHGTEQYKLQNETPNQDNLEVDTQKATKNEDEGEPMEIDEVSEK